VYNAIRTALGSIANVFMDKALRFGLSFQDEACRSLSFE